MRSPYALILLSAALLFAGKASKAPSWQLFDFNTVRPASTGTAFIFPQASTPPRLYPGDSFASYLLKRDTNTYPISGTLTATFAITSTGSPAFNYLSESGNTCSFPAHVRPYFEDGLAGEFDRWWAVEPFSWQLAPGAGLISATIDPANWSSVYGKRGTDSLDALNGFQHAAANVYGIGLSFGGGCFFGHGVNTIGPSAQFQLTGYTFQ